MHRVADCFAIAANGQGRDFTLYLTAWLAQSRVR
jgi:hypothetical protein